MKKGISIPINTLVMLAIAIIVLLAATAWFLLSWTGSSATIDQNQRFRDCCVSWVAAQCPGVPTAWDCRTYSDETGAKTLFSRAQSAGIDTVTTSIRAVCGCTS